MKRNLLTEWLLEQLYVEYPNKAEFILGIKMEWSNAHYKMIVEMKRTD